MRVYSFVLLGALCGLIVPRSAGAAVVTVHVFNYEFSTNPSTGPVVDPTINVGDSVRWQFDDFGHTTTSVAGIPERWNSGFVNLGSSFSHTFTHVGSFEYYCIPHGFDAGNGNAEGMSGVITVRPVPEPAAGLAVVAAGAAALLKRRRGPRSGGAYPPLK